ncbi:YfiT family bacillithiol transferase [Aridibaculum aurantiacum]|uniref:YfiT family bacillithiol transferase n=1 Tax=Aridibaculum aurantiacum TaxID=2810307 RepID=UPI001A967682|nr:putative metal-dependent hydrolase [Aridibaculum aurantiacum]
MTTTNIDPRYPIGEFQLQPFSHKLKEQYLTDLTFLPTDVEMAVLNLDEPQLDTPYREGGWTIRQLVHHIADSHMNAYIRFKLAMTEDNPTITPYQEKHWANLADVYDEPINMSITLLHALHRRLVTALRSIEDGDWESRSVFHPGHQRKLTLWELLGIYSWHSRHHVAHIKALREEKGW